MNMHAKNLSRIQIAERRRLIQLEAWDKSKREIAAVDAGISESVSLRRMRGEDIIQPAKRNPHQVETALQFLLRRKHITPRQLRAGEKYGADYQRCEQGSMGSALGQPERVDCQSLPDTKSGREIASLRLQKARKEALRDQTKLIIVCNHICGQNMRVYTMARNDTREGARIQQTLDIALDLLADHYGY